MGFGNLIGQVVVFTIFLLVIATTMSMYSQQTKSTNEAITYKNRRILEMANTDITFESTAYANGYLSLRLLNDGGTTLDPLMSDIYIDGERIDRTTIRGYWSGCDALYTTSRCGEVGFSDYAWESNGILGIWHLNEDILDASEYGNNGVIVGDMRYGDGKYVNSSWFNGTDGGIQIPQAGTFENTTNGFTVSAWVWLNGTATDQTIVEKGNGILADWQLDIVSGTPTFSVLFDGILEDITVASIKNRSWHLLTGTWDMDNISLYTNGIRSASKEVSGTFETHEYGLTFGVAGDLSNDVLNGSVDEVLLWNRSLSDAEILMLYRKGKETTNPGLWDGSEYLEADIPLSLDAGIHRIDVITENSFKTTKTVVVD